MVSGVYSGFSLHLLVLTVSGCEVGFEVSPSFVSGWFLVPTTTGAHEVSSCKDFAYPTLICCEGPMGTPPASN
jgi:hypothetical protein